MVWNLVGSGRQLQILSCCFSKDVLSLLSEYQDKLRPKRLAEPVVLFDAGAVFGRAFLFYCDWSGTAPVRAGIVEALKVLIRYGLRTAWFLSLRIAILNKSLSLRFGVAISSYEFKVYLETVEKAPEQTSS